MVEGEEGTNFGVIIEGEFEVSLQAASSSRCSVPDDLVGELAFFSHRARPSRTSTVVAMVDSIYLEVNAAAYALASEECQEHFKALVVTHADETHRAGQREA